MGKVLIVILIISFSNNCIHGWVREGTDLKWLAETVLANETIPDLEIMDPKSGLIFPGTKWCGPGDSASDYDDLGPEVATDMCCRAHDHCPDVMPGGATKHNLTNTAIYTRLNCECDLKFLSCLRDVDTLTSRLIGVIYFNAILTQCFKNDFPVVKCEKKGGWLNQKCVKYEFDEHGDKRYQWFDVPDFM